MASQLTGHHWQIEAATGPTSPGVCLNCGERREFKNSLSEGAYGRYGDNALRESRATYLRDQGAVLAYALGGTGMTSSDMS